LQLPVHAAPGKLLLYIMNTDIHEIDEDEANNIGGAFKTPAKLELACRV